MRENAAEVDYSEITILGKPALFSEWRIDHSTVPPGLHLYELRHEDEDWGTPCQVARGVLVNFYGTVLTAEPLKLDEDGRRDIEATDIVHLPRSNPAIEHFLARYGVEGSCGHQSTPITR